MRQQRNVTCQMSSVRRDVSDQCITAIDAAGILANGCIPHGLTIIYYQHSVQSTESCDALRMTSRQLDFVARAQDGLFYESLCWSQ